jgi:hypothetical protein
MPEDTAGAGRSAQSLLLRNTHTHQMRRIVEDLCKHPLHPSLGAEGPPPEPTTKHAVDEPIQYSHRPVEEIELGHTARKPKLALELLNPRL